MVTDGNSWRSEARHWGSVVCISTADYDAPTWTNKQHIMSRLASEVPVLYVESLGLRAPRPTRRDFKRIQRRISSRRRVSARAPTGVVSSPGPEVAPAMILSPLVVPLHSRRSLRLLNRHLLTHQLDQHLDAFPGPRLLWTYSPVVADELVLDRFSAMVYHCVDDLSTVPRVSRRAIAETEPRLVRSAQAVFASSEKLATRLREGGGRDIHLVHNVADFDHFHHGSQPGEVPSDVASIPAPRAIFIGSLNDHKVDWALLSGVARARPDWNFVLIGPTGGEENTSGAASIAALTNVHVLGHRPYEQLPMYLRAATAALIPYRITEHTESVFPMKTWEYLAAGVPVVSTPLPALTAVNPPVQFAGDAREFAAALKLPAKYSESERIAAARRWTWDILLDTMFAFIPRPRTHTPLSRDG